MFKLNYKLIESTKSTEYFLIQKVPLVGIKLIK